MAAKPAQTPFSETAESLHSLAVRLLRRARVADRDAGIGPAQLSALSVLYFAQSLPITALADAEQVAQPTMTRIVNALVDAKLAKRAPSPGDKRVQQVAISAAGRKLFEAARARRLVIIEGLLGQLDPATVTALRPLINEVLAAVNTRD
jgi:DNA-binding MarR family transcriptional regulator